MPRLFHLEGNLLPPLSSIRKLLTLISIWMLPNVLHFHELQAQAPEQWSAGKILHELNRMNTLGTVLYVAAHPDDENTRLISWLVGERKLRTAYLSLTRGDGGQNLIGKEQGPLLGVIRTQELLAARRVDGAEQYFTRAYDFGYSKNPEETLRLWHQDSILKDMVLLIRQLKPDVVICRFPDTGEGGHGHHTASATLAKQAYEKAADPAYLPLLGKAWQSSRLFWNTFSFGTVNTTSEDQISLDAGTFNPLLGTSYGEMASLSRSQHKSQGFGTAAQRGEVKEYFIQWGGEPVQRDLFEGLDFSWNRVSDADDVARKVNTLIERFDVMNPSASLHGLLEVYRELSAAAAKDDLERHWLDYKLRQLKDILLQCAGIWMSASVAEPSAVPGDSLELRLDFIHRTPGKIRIIKATFGDAVMAEGLETGNNQLITIKKKARLDANQPFSTPYWLKQGIVDNQFRADGLPTIAAELHHGPFVKLEFEMEGQAFMEWLPLRHRYVDPVDGEMFQPLMVLPPVTLSWSENVLMLQTNHLPALTLQVKGHRSGVDGHLLISLNDSLLLRVPFNLSEKGSVLQFTFPWEKLPRISNPETLKLEAEVDGKIYGHQLIILDYPHIPKQSILSPAEIRVVPLDIRLSGGKIGYIAGAGDEMPAALRQLGYQVEDINEQNFETQDWRGLKAIVTGVRAHNTHAWLNAAHPKLMQFVQDGGTLLLQYNTNNRLGPLIAMMGPFEFTITRDRVTDELAEVRFLMPDHPVLLHPNTLRKSDFEGWVQERGVYFAGQRSSEFQALFSMNDPGEKPLDGSTIIARHGKGHFIYTGLALFRQLPAGVPGAYRLLVNLLEVGN